MLYTLLLLRCCVHREDTVPELRRKLKSLAAQLTEEQRRVASLRAGTTSQILHRAELEDFFIQCIEASHFC
jgi:hypothetical protein